MYGNQTIAHLYRARSFDVICVEAEECARVASYLQWLEEELERLVTNLDPTVPRTRRYRRLRLDAITSAGSQRILETFDLMHGMVLRDLVRLTEAEGRFAVSAVDAGLGGRPPNEPDCTVGTSSTSQKLQVHGRTVQDWWSEIGEWFAHCVRTELTTAMTLGEDVDRMLRRLRGAPTGKVIRAFDVLTESPRHYRQSSGGLMEVVRDRAFTLVKGCLEACVADSRRAAYEQMDRLLVGVQQISALGDETRICAMHAGASWSLEGKPLPPTHLSWKGWGPLHWDCRRVVIPLLKPWDELRLAADSLPNAVRLALDGRPVADQPFEGWFQALGPQMQELLIGQDRAAQWRRGGVTLAMVMDQHGQVAA
jgi:hypothetical protein